VLELPVADDLAGHVLEAAFTEDWRSGHPVERVPTWDPYRVR
jgi:hypothetical protein